MKKRLLFVLVILLSSLFFASCGRNPEPDAVSSATQNKRPDLEPLLRRIMPEAMADGMVKIAIVRNLTGGDYGRQYLESCIAEGRAMGFTVDSYVLSGNNEHNRDKILRIAGADYDGLIFTLVGESLPYGEILPGVDKRIKIISFDDLPYKDDDPRKEASSSVTAAAQDDERLAEISLAALIDSFAPGAGPIRLISIKTEPGIHLLDRRNEVYDRYVREGKITEIAAIRPQNFVHIRSSIREALIKTLADYPPGTVDAIWAPYDEFAKGCIDAFVETGRKEIKMTSIDISNDTIKLMLDNAGQWIATAATDPSIAGVLIMRLMAGKLAGENVPSACIFDVQLIETSVLNHSITMANIPTLIPGWPSPQGLFEYHWMAELKDSVARRW